MSQIVCKDLLVGYDVPVAGKLDFTVNAGDYIAVIGENGAGKSTLMRTLLGLQKPLGGSIVREDGRSRKETGYLPQQSEAQRDFPASCMEVVLSGFSSASGLRPFYNKREKERAKENLRRTGMSGFEKRSFRTLSGGQKQRVLLARALCATDTILFLDEPVSGLDPAATEEMYEVMKALHGEGTTIFMISHDVEGVLRYATHVLRMGSEPFFGTKEEYLAAKK